MDEKMDKRTLAEWSGFLTGFISALANEDSQRLVALTALEKLIDYINFLEEKIENEKK